MANFTGTNGDDRIFGTNNDDVIFALDGNDEIRGKKGNDLIHAGSGNDTVEGEDDNDTIYGEAGSDSLSGGNGNDDLTGGANFDIIDGGSGVDTARYSGSIHEYAFAPFGGGFFISHNGGAGADGTDFVINVEQLVFADAVIDTTVNNAPIAQDDSVSTDEDVGTYSSGSASVTDNDFDFEGSTLTVTPGTFNGTYGTLVLNADGTYTYTPYASVQSLAQGDSVQDSFSYTVSDGSLSDTGNLVFTIAGVNDAPVANADTAMTGENAAVLVDVLDNDTDVDNGAVLTVIAASAPSGQGSATVVGDQVQFDPGTDFDHLDTGETANVLVSYTIADEHGATSSSTISVTVHGANDAPVANDDTDDTDENTSVSGNVLANDTDADVEPLTVTNPATYIGAYGTLELAADGSYTYTPGGAAALLDDGETVEDVFNYTASDGTATDSATLTITVTGLSGAPNANDDTASTLEDDSVSGNVLDNDTDSEGDPLTVANPGTYAGTYGTLTLDADGSYTYTPNAAANGLAADQVVEDVFNYTATDGTGSDSATLTVTVTGTNDAPTIDVGGTDASGSVTELPDGDPGENATVHTDSGAVAFDDVDVADTHSAGFTPLGGGYLGTFTLDPVDQMGDSVGWDFSVSDAALDGLTEGEVRTQTYAVEIDDGHGGTVTQNVTITLTGAGAGVAPQTEWYIDNSAAGSANLGTEDDPYTSIAAFNAAQGTVGGPQVGHDVYLLAGTGTYAEADGINLLSGQVLTGVADGAVRPTIVATAGDGINVAANNSVSGVDIGSTSGAGIADSGGSVGTLTVSDVAKSGTGQIADLDNGGSLAVTLNSAESLASSGGAIDLAGVAGSFTVSGATTIAGVHSGGGIDITGSSVTATFAGGGTVSTADAVAVNFVGNSGALAIGGGLAIVTTSATGLNATGGGTVTATGAGNSITSGTGTALNIANTNIGAADLIFDSISAGAAVGSAGVGIRLDTTGSAGGLHVTGTGTAGSGGTIQNKTGADGSTSSGIGIYLNNTADVQLGWMQLNDFGNFAIRGNNVTDFSLTNSVISGANGTAGGAFDEAAISFTGLFGSAAISDTTIGNGFEYVVKVANSSGTLDRLTMDNVSFGTNSTSSGGDAVQIAATGTATVNVTVTDSDFSNAREDLFNAVATQNANLDVVFSGNDLSNNHANKASAASHILVSSTSRGTVTYDISSNDLTTGATGSAIAAAKGVPDTSPFGGTMSGTIDANTIGVAGVAGSGSEFSGIYVSALGSGTHTTAITNNVVRHYNEVGILLEANEPATGGNSVLNATVTGNQTLEPGSFAFAGLWVVAGSGSGIETNIVNVTIGSSTTPSLANDFTNGDPFDFADVFLQESGSGSAINLSRAGSAAATPEAVVQDNNIGTPAVFVTGTVNLVNTLPPEPAGAMMMLSADMLMF